MQFSRQAFFYLPNRLRGGARFHRRHPQQAPDAACICIANALAEQETDATSAVLLWCRGRLQHGSIDPTAVNDAFKGVVISMSVVNTLSSAFSPEFISTQSGSTVTKDELRAELERQEQRYKEVYGGEVTTYAAQPEPERKPWRKRATVQDQAFIQELQKMEKELKAEEP
jgi:hypothetical protein